MQSAMRRTRPFSLMVNASRASRHASSASAAARGCDARGRGRSELSGAAPARRAHRGRRTRSRSRLRAAGRSACDALRACAARRGGGACAARRGRSSRSAPSPRRTRRALPRVARRPRRPRRVDRGIELFGDRERGRARAVDAGWARPRTARAGWRAARRARVPARAGRRRARPRASRPPRTTPVGSSAARSVSSANGIEVDALTARPNRRQQVVGTRRDEHDDRARPAAPPSVFSSAFAATRLVARTASRPRRASAPCAHPRPGCGALRGGSCRGRRRPVRRAAGLELDDVGMHAALHEPHARASSSAPISSAANWRAASSTPEPRGPTSRYACDGRSAARSSASSARSCPTTSVTSSAQARALRERGSTAAHTRSATSSRRAARVDDPPAPFRGERRGTRRARRRGTRRRPAPCGRASAATHAPRRRRRGGRARRRGRVRARRPRTRSAARPCSTPSPRPDTLVRQRRRREAIAHHDRARGERGPR